MIKLYKLSPLTNHRNTKKGVIKGGFDRTNLFQQAEKDFDELFNYNRSFEYYNTMKNGRISEQLNMQEQIDAHMNTDKQAIIYADKQANEHISNNVDRIKNKFANIQIAKPENSQPLNQENKQYFNAPDLGLSSVLGIFTPEPSFEEPKQPTILKKKKKKPKRGFRQS
jgi:hypothetical protein